MQLTLNELIIIESLRMDDFPTGSALAKYLTEDDPIPIPVTLLRPKTADELIATLTKIAIRAEQHRGAWIPMLHLEMHGDDLGIETTSGEDLNWYDLAIPLRHLNIATRNSLIVALAVCDGAYIAKAAAAQPLEPAPFCGIIGPDSSVNSLLLMHGFRAFYIELIKTEQFQLALHQLQQRSLPEYRAFDTGDIFRKGIRNYERTYFVGQKLHGRLSGIMKRHAKAGTRKPSGAKVSRRELLRRLKDKQKRLDQHWNHFIMADRFPENLSRFGPLKPVA